jgi:hypothetical protein
MFRGFVAANSIDRPSYWRVTTRLHVPKGIRNRIRDMTSLTVH